jgi:hypothetical protein
MSWIAPQSMGKSNQYLKIKQENIVKVAISQLLEAVGI